MLTFKVIGPDGNGHYSVVYKTPGNLQSTQHSIGYSQESAEQECACLNSLQVVSMRLALADRSSRIVRDL